MVLQEMLISLPVCTLLNIPPPPAHTISSAVCQVESLQGKHKGCERVASFFRSNTMNENVQYWEKPGQHEGLVIHSSCVPHLAYIKTSFSFSFFLLKANIFQLKHCSLLAMCLFLQEFAALLFCPENVKARRSYCECFGGMQRQSPSALCAKFNYVIFCECTNKNQK